MRQLLEQKFGEKYKILSLIRGKEWKVLNGESKMIFQAIDITCGDGSFGLLV